MNKRQIEKHMLAEILEKLKLDVLKSEKAFAAIEINTSSHERTLTIISIEIEIPKSKSAFGDCSIPTCRRSATQKYGIFPFCDKHGSCLVPTGAGGPTNTRLKEITKNHL